MGKHEGAELELVLRDMQRWLDELVEVDEQLRVIEGVLCLELVRSTLEDRREAIYRGLRSVDRKLVAMREACLQA